MSQLEQRLCKTIQVNAVNLFEAREEIIWQRPSSARADDEKLVRLRVPVRQPIAQLREEWAPKIKAAHHCAQMPPQAAGQIAHYLS